MAKVRRSLRKSKAVIRKRPKTLPRDRLVLLCRELDMQMDGVAVPASAAAILNAIRSLLSDIEEPPHAD